MNLVIRLRQNKEYGVLPHPPPPPPQPRYSTFPHNFVMGCNGKDLKILHNAFKDYKQTGIIFFLSSRVDIYLHTVVRVYSQSRVLSTLVVSAESDARTVAHSLVPKGMSPNIWIQQKFTVTLCNPLYSRTHPTVKHLPLF